ncbi:hypothetical protein VTN77DRAFT_6510 [Rasamsonia byssochlamydoides]|uniref:uncharacterized protein n=1 Tax=Rasamsonia byssochlamydoides TaxID=89139 RepID=UPI003741EA7C
MTSMSAPILRTKCMNYDDVAWERSGKRFDVWKRDKLLKRENLIAVGKLIDKWRGGVPDTLVTPPTCGAFNVCIRMKFVDGGSAILRVPCRGVSMFPEEKVRQEVSVMRFLEHHTNIPVPHALHHGMTEESSDGLGPVIIMEYIEHDYDLVDALNTPGISDHERPILDPQISEDQLESACGQMADIMLQLSKHTFTEIGCIARVDEGDDFDDRWVTKHCPLTLNMNELVQVGNFPPHLLPQGPFQTSSLYYLALAEMYIATQRNDVIESAEDCRRKYIARCLFRKLAREGHLGRYSDHGPLKLFCDDLHPANVLMNTEFKVVLCKREDVAIQCGLLTEEHHLSPYMRESWESGDSWVNYAARRSWAFDMIYWAKIDRRFFGDGDLEDRLRLLTPEERGEIDRFVQKKLEEKEERR